MPIYQSPNETPALPASAYDRASVLRQVADALEDQSSDDPVQFLRDWADREIQYAVPL